MIRTIAIAAIFWVLCLGPARAGRPAESWSATLPAPFSRLAYDPMAHQVSQNVRFQLFRRGVPREDWSKVLHERAGLDSAKVTGLLRGRLDDAEILPHELKQLADAVGLPSDCEELRFSDLLANNRTNVFVENVIFLLGSLKKGQKQELASFVGVTPTTISRWAKTGKGMGSARLSKFLQFFGLATDTDLRKSPLFLDDGPVSVAQCREWAVSQLEQLGDQDFQALYPALRRLLEER